MHSGFQVKCPLTTDERNVKPIITEECQKNGEKLCLEKENE